MELHKAIHHAVNFAAKGKDSAEILRNLRFRAKTDRFPACIQATDGDVGVVVVVDQDVPDVSISVENASAMPKEPLKSVKIGGTPDDLHFVAFTYNRGSYQVPLVSTIGYPAIPPIPSRWLDLAGWEYVRVTAHAALKPDGEVQGTARPDLECIHFTEDRVEATDGSRMVLADVDTGLKGHLSAKTFSKITKKARAQVAGTSTHGWFRFTDELRYALWRDGVYAHTNDFRNLLPEFTDGPYLSVETKDLKSKVRHATKFSSVREILLKFSEGSVSLEVLGNRESLAIVDGIGPALYEQIPMPSVLVDGKLLLDTLKHVATPRVRLCYSGPTEPLRLESGGWVAALWPKST